MMFAQRNWNAAIGLALFLLVATLCGFAAALLGSKTGEVATSLASLIAGIFALIAGGFAYVIGSEQIQWLRTNERRRLARDVLIAARLFEGVLSRIEDDIDRLQKLVAQYDKPNATVPTDWRELIRKPDISVVWDRLGLFWPETITTYLDLDAELESYRERQIGGVQYHKDQLAKFKAMVRHLRDQIAGEAKSSLGVLSATQDVAHGKVQFGQRG